MDFEEPRKIDFLKRLINLTELGKINWSLGRDEYWIKASLNRFTYAVTSSDKDDLAPYQFMIFPTSPPDAKVRPPAISEWKWDLTGNTPFNETLRELYFVAKRRAIGVDTLLDDMLEDLDDIK